MSGAPVRWFEENEVGGARFALRMDRVLVEERTAHQHLILFENAHFGRVLTLDGYVQLTEADEFIYHEMLAHVPLAAHGAVKRLLVIGGGDGGILREALKSPTLTAATLCEIDASVVEFSREHLDFVSNGAFDDARTQVVIEDAAQFITAKTGKITGSDGDYEAILVDSTDPDGPGEALFSERFYADCKTRLAPGGVIAVQAGLPFLQPDVLRTALKRLSNVFDHAGCYQASVPSYAGGVMTLGLASDDPAIFAAPADALGRHAEQIEPTRHWSPKVHKAAFALPHWIEALSPSP